MMRSPKFYLAANMRFVQHVFVLLLMLMSALPVMAQSTYELSNANVAVAVDADGRLTKLTNVKTGHNYLASAGHELWKMYYKTSDARELEIPFAKQKAQVRKGGKSIIIYYPSLTGNVALATASRPLKVAFTLRADLQDDRITWTATIKNSEKEPHLEISELWLPWI